MFDLLIKNAQIYDGTGTPSYMGDLAVLDGKIAAVGQHVEGSAKRVVDAQGLALSPGFIDGHSHSDTSLFSHPQRLHVLKMGVTTEVAGQCSHSIAPVNRELTPAEYSMLNADRHFPSFREMRETIETLELGTNQVYFTGHANLRTLVMSIANRHANDAEIAQMSELLAKTMEEGSLGYSTGLSYVPGIYSDSHELIEIAKALKPYGGIYVSHSRSESAGLFKSVQECIDIAREAEVPVNISHFKVVGKTFWPRCDEALRMIDEANASGLNVTLDAYPYIAVSTTILSAMPPRFLDHGAAGFAKMLEDPAIVEEVRREIYEIDDPSWDNSAYHVGLENFLIVRANETPQFVGKNYVQVGQELGLSPFEAAMYMIRANHGYVYDVRFAMCEENLEKILKHPTCVLGSDGIYVHGRDTTCHPRALGSFPRYLGHYVRDRGILSREEGIRRVTGMTADRYCLTGKGYLKEGYDADLVLFDYDNIIDHADFQDPFRPNEGIHQVYMKGQLVLEDNCETGLYLGRYIEPKLR